MDIASAAATTSRLLVLAVAGLLAAGCSGNSSSSPASQPPATSSASPAAPAGTNAAPAAAGTETPPPGDIPDSTVYIPYSAASGPYVVKVPQGWAQTVTAAGAVSFTDKLNSITITTVRAAAPTLASARATEVPQIQGSVQRFALAGLSVVTRPAGSVILIRYSAQSQPDPVTGKVYMDSVERYEFYRNGIEAVVTLSGPAGADNVDPWRTVTGSFRWLR
jgi:hypothetical protein